MRKMLFFVLVLSCSVKCQIKDQYRSDHILAQTPEVPAGLDIQGGTVPMFPEGSKTDGRKSVGLAALYSFLLPGMGELYAGDYSFGKYLTIVEGGLVVTLLGFDRYANWLQDDARGFAVRHAQVNINGKDDQFFTAIGDFDNIYAYNDEILRERNVTLYNPGAGYFWQWDNTANRNIYRDQKIASDERFNDTRFIAAAIAVNHLISIVDAVRTAIRHNKNLSQGNAYDLHADVIGGIAAPRGVRLTLIHSF